MHCGRCNSPMIITEHVSDQRSTQIRYECTSCNGERLLTTENLHQGIESSRPARRTDEPRRFQA